MTDMHTTQLLEHERAEEQAEEHYRLYIRPLLPQAKVELADEIMSGKRIGKVDLESVIDELLQSESYHDFIQRIANATAIRDIYWQRRYLEQAVMDYLDNWPDMVETRARRMAE